MDHREQNIYSTKRPGAEKDFKAQRSRILDHLSHGEVKHNHRRTLTLTALLVTLLLCAGLVALLTYNQPTLWRDARMAKQSSKQTFTKATSTIDLEADMKTLFITDDLEDIFPTEIPTDVRLPFSSTWVKQAAYHVVNAESSTRAGLTEDALASYQDALRIYPELQGIHAKMGLLYLRQKDFQDAAKAFEVAAKQETQSEGVASNLGVAYMGLKRYDRAKKQFLAALRLKPKYAIAQRNLATLYIRMDKEAEASQAFSKYLDLKPNDLEATQKYAFLLVQLEQWQEAIDLLSRINREASDIPPVYFNLAVAWCQLENFEEALFTLKQATDLVDGRHSLVWMSKPEFDPMRSTTGFQELIAKVSKE